MRLNKDYCLGARIKGKDVVGIRYKGQTIYPPFVPEDPYSNYYTIVPGDVGINGYGFYVKRRDCGNDYVLETNWGDETIDSNNYHYYGFFGTSGFTFSSNGFPDLYSSYSLSDRAYWIKAVHYIRPDIIDGSYLFAGHTNVTSKKLYIPETSHMTDMNNMFYNCSKLTSLNLSKFDTSNVTNMGEMFYDCTNLTKLNLSSFNTRNVTNMSEMFYNCASLTTLDLSSFKTSNVNDMDFMFFNCTNLVELNLSNFTFVGDETRMFEGCINLKKLDLSNCKCYKHLDDHLFGTYEENMCLNLIEIRLDNCDYETVKNISRTLINIYDREPRGKIYINRAAYEQNGETVWCPNGWDFVNCETNEVIN
jgi:surface protein